MSSAKSDGHPSEGPGAKPGSKTDTNDDLKTLPVAEVEKRLASSPKGPHPGRGDHPPGTVRAERDRSEKVNQFLKFLSYFWGPIPWMIEVAVILSAVLGHWPDFIYHFDLAAGQRQHRVLGRTPGCKAIDALKAELAIKARVLRDGQWVNPPARELVPGDIIRLRLGDIVPADARLLEGTRLRSTSRR